MRALLLAALLLAAAAHAQPVVEIPSAYGSLTHAAWKPVGRIERWIVSLHGTGGSAKRDLEAWQKSLGGRPERTAQGAVGVLAILEGRFGPRPLSGTRWVTACGERDPMPERDGCPGMRRTGSLLREQGAQVVLAIEDPNTGHGALQFDPRKAARMLELFSR